MSEFASGERSKTDVLTSINAPVFRVDNGSALLRPRDKASHHQPFLRCTTQLVVPLDRGSLSNVRAAGFAIAPNDEPMK
jgi:hypothetical protein